MSHAFSAPGKALVAGGYLVLDPAYNAYVTALSSRMHALIEPATPKEGAASSVLVRSPQFNGEWHYEIDANGAVTETSGRHNPFLAAAIRCVVAYARPSRFGAAITLYSDPGYHTRAHTTARASGAKTFLYHLAPVEQVAKTGMGLSAGLVTVVCAALLAHVARPLEGEGEHAFCRTVHNLAQIAHCDAQGKIGSGFDVAAAVYGSIVYRRFAPSDISHLLAQPPSAAFSAALRAAVDCDWHFRHAQCTLPPGVRLLMGDVSGGSATPRLVLQVLAWRARDPAAPAVYAQLDRANEELMAAMAQLHAQYAKDPDAYWRQFRDFLQPLADALAAIRAGLQRLTAASGADIEPPAQTALLDRCRALPGCLGGVVPGAGGFDAVCLLVEEHQLPNLLRAAKLEPGVTWLDLTEEATGLKLESPADYLGLE